MTALPIIEQPVPGRECGTCSLCCKLPTLDYDDGRTKPLNTWCADCTPGLGCNIYDSRPIACRTFMCQWLADPGWPEELSPRKTQCVVVTDLVTLLDGTQQPCIRVHENAPNASHNIDRLLYLAFCSGFPTVVYDMNGHVRSIVWDIKGARHTVLKIKAQEGVNQLPTADWNTVNAIYKGDINQLREEAEAGARERGLEPL